MLEQEFEQLSQFVITAGPTESRRFSSQFEILAALICRTRAPDGYTEDALEGVRVALANLAIALASDRLPGFTIARLRYSAREAILAAQDEWRRQNS